MSKPNNLSGIYFRYQNPETGKWENWCFEDLPVEKQDEYMMGRDPEWLQGMVKKLAATLKHVGDEFGITTES
jgi:hypothetical protein